MKNILVLTDFSENSDHAAESAAVLAGKLHANLLLCHNYQDMPVSPIYAGGVLVVGEPAFITDESKSKLTALEKRLRTIIQQLDEDDRQPVIHAECHLGNLSENLKAIIARHDVELVVMGARSNQPLTHFFFGSDTLSVVRSATCPVLIIPVKHDIIGLQKIVFATNFDKADTGALHYLIKLAKLFGCGIDIVHLLEEEEKKAPENEKEILFRESIGKLKYPKLNYHHENGNDVVRRLNLLCKKTSSGLLAIVHRHNSLLISIVKHSTTKEILANQNLPLLVFPSK